MVASMRMFGMFSLLCSLLITLVDCQGYNDERRMLIENCDWGDRNQDLVLMSLTSKATFSMPPQGNHDLAANLVCKKKVSTFKRYDLMIKISRFELSWAPEECDAQSERLTIIHEGNKSVTWCGSTYPEVFFVDSSMELVYNSGIRGEGPGFDLEITRVSLGRQDIVIPVLTASSKPKLLYSPHYPGYKRNVNLSYLIKAPGDKRVYVRSRVMDLEQPSPRCQYDYVSFMGEDLQVRHPRTEKFCGDKKVEFIVPYTRNETYINFVTDDTEQFQGFVFEYSAIDSNVFQIENQNQDYKAEIKELYTPHVISMEEKNIMWPLVDYKVQTTVEIRSAVDNSVDSPILVISIPPHQVHNENCRDVEIWAGYDDEWQFKDCKAPFSTMHTQGSNLKLRIISKSERVLAARYFHIIVSAVTRVPREVTAEPRMTFIWFNKLAGLTSRKPFYVSMSSDDGSCMYFEAATNNLRYTSGMMDQGTAPNESFSLSVGEKVAIYNGPEKYFFDLTKNCGSQVLNKTRIYSHGKNTVSVENESEGYWLAFKTSFNCRHEPTMKSLTDTSGSWDRMQIRPGSYCIWRLQNPNLQWIQFKAKIQDGGLGRFKLTEVSGDLRNDLAVVNKTEGAGDWLYSKASELEIFLSSSEDIQSVGFEYNIMRNPSEYQVSTSCEMQFLTATTEEKTASSINYPNFYLSNVECKWLIRIPQEQRSRYHLVVKFSRLPCQDGERVTLRSREEGYSAHSDPVRNLCDTPGQTELEVNGDVLVAFYSDHSLVHPGFQFKYYLKKVTSNCGQIFYLNERGDQDVLSGNFPLNSGISTCEYTIRKQQVLAVKFTIHSWSTSPSYLGSCYRAQNRLEFWEKYRDNSTRLGEVACSYKEPFIVSNGEEVQIKVIRTSNAVINFNMSIQAIDNPDFCDYRVVLQRGDVLIVTNPNYPNEASYRECMGLVYQPPMYSGDYSTDEIDIHVVRSLLTYSSRLDIYGGNSMKSDRLFSYGTGDSRSIHAYSRTILIHFRGTGVFKIELAREGHGGTGSPSSSGSGKADFGNKSATIIGSVLGAVAIIVVVVCTVIVTVKKRRMHNHERVRRHIRSMTPAYNRQDSSVFIVNPVIVNNNNSNNFAAPPPYPGRTSPLTHYGVAAPAYDELDYQADSQESNRQHNSNQSYNVDGESPPSYDQVLRNGDYLNPGYSMAEAEANLGGNRRGSSDGVLRQSDARYSLARAPRETRGDDYDMATHNVRDEGDEGPNGEGEQNLRDYALPEHTTYDHLDPTDTDDPPLYEETAFGSSSTDYDIPPPPPYESSVPRPGATNQQPRRGHLGSL